MSALAGARIVNTRAAHQAGALDAVLTARGAEPVSFPCIDIAPPSDPRPFAAAIEGLVRESYDWLVFTSANAVVAVARALGEGSISPNVRVVAIGVVTAESVRTQLRIDAVTIPEEHSALGLAASLSVAPGERILLPGSAIARPEVGDGLQKNGAIVNAVTAYQTTVGAGGTEIAPLLARGEIDAIAFASPSAVNGFTFRLGESKDAVAAARLLPVACLGETTAARARQLQFGRVSTSAQQNIFGLVDVLEMALAPFRKGVLRCP